MVPIRYFVVKCRDEWRVEFEDRYENGFKLKKEAIQHATQRARKRAQQHLRCEVLVQDENALWYTAWTSEDI